MKLNELKETSGRRVAAPPTERPAGAGPLAAAPPPVDFEASALTFLAYECSTDVPDSH
jgi:hypothetical protein